MKLLCVRPQTRRWILDDAVGDREYRQRYIRNADRSFSERTIGWLIDDGDRTQEA